MPVQKVTTPTGQVGYRWGAHGHTYTGAGAEQKAAAQGQAVYASGYKQSADAARKK